MGNRTKKPLFTSSVAAEILGIHPRTLMIYEKAGLIKPFRSQTNRRLYSENDLEEVRFIRFLTEEKNININGIKYLLKAIRGVKGVNLKKKLFPDFEEGKPLF